MAAIRSLGSTWNTTAGSKTRTDTPAVGELIVVVASSSGLAGGTTSVSDDQGGTFTQVDTDRTGFSTTGVLTVWVRDSLVSSAVSTIYTAAQVGSSGGGLSVLAVSGMLAVGAAAVRSNGGESAGTLGTTPAPVLNQTPLLSNPIISAVSNGTAGGGTTARNGYADVAIAGYNTPPTGLDLCYLNAGETTATITWGGNSATAFASVAIELDAPFVAQPSRIALGDVADRARHIVNQHASIYKLRPPAVVDIPPAPPPPAEENLAPVIYGYGAM